uniref:NADH-ubiquinone oxidoreductase chain 1 n=1 Tax=Atta colombica TaxID=520822 RepID=A0A249RWF1_9HYME|nr:NADH dehydrogenase subunit 1 [Atta colombica]
MILSLTKYMMLNLISLLILEIYVLVSVAFLTLLERKILGYVQERKGPNKVGISGFLQPFSDAIKLFSKEVFIIYKSNYYMYYICPIILFMLMMSNWLIYSFETNIYYLNYSLLILIIILTIMGYMFMFMGWFSNSSYSLMGAVRAISQTLSYEVSLIMIFLVLMILSESYSFTDFMKWQMYMWYGFMLSPLFLIFFVSVLAELNRSPMDFVEGESELVSGFNVEYFSGVFALIFMAEYGMIIFFSYLMVSMFTDLSGLGASVYINLMVFVIILMRGILPRMRYDELMYLCWKIILPFILNYMIFILMFKFMFVYL